MKSIIVKDLKVCDNCKTTYGVHGKEGHELDLHYKKLAQEAWEKKYGDRDKFREIFGRSYL